MPDVLGDADVGTEVLSEVVLVFRFAVDELAEGVMAVVEGCGEEAARHGSLEAVGSGLEIGGVEGDCGGEVELHMVCCSCGLEE